MTCFDFDIVGPLEFIGDGKITSLTRHDVEKLMDKPVDPNTDPLTLEDGFGNKKEVRTCREYRVAVSGGYYPVTTIGIKKASYFFEMVLGILDAVSASRVPERSYIENPRRGVVDLALMPAHLIMCGFVPEEEAKKSIDDARKAGTIQNLVKENLAQVKEVSSDMIRIEYGEGFVFHELMRGSDIDGDGIEDILVYMYNYAIGGTFGAGAPIVLARRSEDGLFERTTPETFTAAKTALCP
jgi:hypothetical protein